MTFFCKKIMFPIIFIYFVFCIILMFIVGLTDAIEYQYFNREIYRHHNFPDVLMRNDFHNLNSVDAFYSGIMCSLILLVTFLLKCVILILRNKNLNIKDIVTFHSYLLIVLILGIGLILVTYDKKHDRIDRNHIWMYTLFGAVESLSTFHCFRSVISTRSNEKKND